MKWLLVIILGLGVYYFGFNTPQGEFDANGQPKVVLFVIDNCPPCDDAINHLGRMRIDFELFNPLSNQTTKQRFKPYGKSFGSQQYPVLVIGNDVATGYAKYKVNETYAKAFGLSALARQPQRLYQAHFQNGQAKVVMYGTSWCGYCAKARSEFADNSIDYVEWDVEKNTDAATRFKQLGGNGYPLIYVGFERFNQVDSSAVKKALRKGSEPI